MIWAILSFLIITLGLGSFAFWAGFSKINFFEKILVSLGLGLALIPFCGVFFNLLRIPVDYRIFLALAAASLCLNTLFLNKKRTGPQPVLSQIISWQDLTVFLVFALSLLMYLQGSFAYSWLGGSSDPYWFISSAKYIEIERTYFTNFQFWRTAEPYPQGYQILIAIMAQASQSINWAAKFFTSLAVALSLFFFYLFAGKLFQNKTAALWATILLASMPAWLTHYIFSLNLAMALVPFLFYCLEKTNQSRRWILLSAIVLASIWYTHFYTAVVATLLGGVYCFGKIFSQNNPQKRIAASLLAGLFLGSIFWIISFIRHPEILTGGTRHVLGFLLIARQNKMLVTAIILFILTAFSLYFSQKFWFPKMRNFFSIHKIKYFKPVFFYLLLAAAVFLLLTSDKIIRLLGSGSMPYFWHHFFAFRIERNLIQNPFGIGPPGLILAIAAFLYLIYKTPRLFTPPFTNQTTIFLFAIFSFLGVKSGHFAINLMPFRMWNFFAMAAALLGGLFYNEFIRRKINRNWQKIFLLLLLFALVAPGWHHNKYKLNTSVWDESFISIAQSRRFYAWLKNNFPKNSKVYSMGVCQSIPIAHDMLSFIWDKEVRDYKGKDVSDSLRNNYRFLKEKGYRYVAVDYPNVFFYTFHRGSPRGLTREAKQRNALQRAAAARRKIESMQNSDKYSLVERFEHAAIFKLR